MTVGVTLSVTSSWHSGSTRLPSLFARLSLSDIMHILHISRLLICAYSCIFCSAYCCIFRAHFCIFKYAYYGIFTLCIFKHITHISAYKMHIYAYFRLIMHIYCIFLICIFVHISCMYGTAYFVHISTYLNLNTIAYLPLCIFKFISAYLHLLCLFQGQSL